MMTTSYQKSIKLFRLRLKILNIQLNALLVYNGPYIKTKIRTYGDKIYTDFCGLNILEDDIVSESFTVISIDSLLATENKYHL